MSTLRLLAALAGACLATGCFFYDSRWGQAKASQQHVAAQRMPSSLRSDGAAEHTPAQGAPLARAAQGLHVRVYATLKHARTELDWQRQFEQLLSDSNPTLRHDFGVEISSADYQAWPSATSDDDLNALLHALTLADPGSDVDWVIGLASSIPMLAESPDQLGVGAITGKHVLIRAMDDAQEFDAIQHGFDELSDEQRRELYRARKRHKAAAVLLHELGHTLGIPHELSSDTLMNARYSNHASDYSERAIAIGKLTLAYRRHDAGQSEPGWASQVLSAIRAAPEHTWDPKTSTQLIALLEAKAAGHGSGPSPAARPLAPPAATGGPPTTAAAEPGADLAGLNQADRTLLGSALAAQQRHALDEAWRLATPLFGKYPNSFTVQNLRCELAMARGGSWEQTRLDCAALMNPTLVR